MQSFPSSFPFGGACGFNPSNLPSGGFDPQAFFAKAQQNGFSLEHLLQDEGIQEFLGNFPAVLDNILKGASEAAAASGSGTSKGEDGVIVPRTNISTSPDSPSVTASIELPGFAKSDVNISFADEKIIVSATSPPAVGEDTAIFEVKERKSGRFVKELKIAKGVKADEIKASMSYGVLTLTYPKAGQEPEGVKVNIE